MTRSAKIGYLYIAIFSLGALLIPPFLPYSPFSFDQEVYAVPSFTHLLGTNHLGQDVFTQLIYGARTTLLIGFAVALLSTFLSASLGVIAGYSRTLDPFINGLGNILIVLPSLLLIIIITSFTSSSLPQLIIVLGLLTWAPYMRIIRASTLTLKEREFVKASRLYGGSSLYVLRKHIIPHLKPLIKTKFILSFRSAILTEAGLSFLGLGDPNVITWGKMLHEGFSKNTVFFTNAWQWVLVPPIVLLIFLTIAVVLIGEVKPLGARIKKKEGSGVIAAVQPSQQHIIELHQLSVHYGENMILRDIDLSVGYNKIVTIIGQSGSGKTTLGKTIYGLMDREQVTGLAFVQQIQLYNPAEQATLTYWKDLAFIYQDPSTALNPVLSIGHQFFEVLDSSLSTKQKKELVVKALEEVQLPRTIIHKLPHECSGGMLNRVMIALAFIHRPRLVIADESTSGLDPIIKREMIELMVAKARENDSTLLFITHDVDIAMYISDELVELEDGQIVRHEVFA
ncbi:ABC transporter permease subunit [Bacillus norwichensis]|uniref:Dipeptide/oligopeptide/nickel ABC transporter permease/ATP-binding protein n=1 Tax=Bacillus norwichensis TaxID=2762217 RepID=A0ABR8VNY9_9BACI|nr:ABC transporter permease subunit [Bacillus norwichensis]MBD8006474.1 dipeptide/oligopeptide/nickel ABC transporter permease/ATP-binding protein [Bacillus norwichensis]